jgi:hypothetical protein
MTSLRDLNESEMLHFIRSEYFDKLIVSLNSLSSRKQELYVAEGILRWEMRYEVRYRGGPISLCISSKD